MTTRPKTRPIRPTRRRLSRIAALVVLASASVVVGGPEAGAGTGGVPDCPAPQFVGTDDDDEWVIEDDRIIRTTDGVTVKMGGLAPGRIVIDGLDGDDTFDVSNRTESTVMCSEGDLVSVTGGTGYVVVLAKGDLEVVTHSGTAIFAVGGDATITTTEGAGDRVGVEVLGDATVTSGDGMLSALVLGAAVIDAGGGDDQIFTGYDGFTTYDEDDWIDAGPGDDVVWTRDGDDTVLAGDGDDEVWTGEGDDIVFGGDGDDFIRSGEGTDEVFGQDGLDDCDGTGPGDSVRGPDDTYHSCEFLVPPPPPKGPVDPFRSSRLAEPGRPLTGRP